DLLQFTFANQPLFLGAVFAVVNYWFNAGKPRTNETRHSFTEWGQVLDWIEQDVFKGEPLMDGHEEAKERSSKPNLPVLRHLALKIEETNNLGSVLSATDITNLCHEENLTIPGLSPDHQADIDSGKKQIGKIMKQQFGESQEITIEGFRIVKTQ